MKFALLFSVITAAILAASSVAAADPLGFEVNALEEKPGLISVVVTATDASGKPITDLNASNFKATLGGTELPISSVDAPGSGIKQTTSIVLLVDVSGSMYGDSIVQARAALQEFVRSLDPSDQVAVLAFSNGVTQLQDYTTNRTLVNTAITKLTAFGDTALYDAVTQATQKATASPASRKLVVLLSDGVSTVNNAQREPSIELARTSGVTILPVGLGSEIDRAYLQEVATASGGRVIAASTAASLGQAYTNLAASIRNRYTVHITVPTTADRTVPATLSLRLTAGGQTAAVERQLDPLPGAKPPGFELKLSGLTPNQEIAATQVLTPTAGPGISIAKVEYLVDGKAVQVASAAPFTFSLDGSQLSPGTHLIRAIATDARGATAETEVAFNIPVPAKSSSLGKLLPILALLLVVCGIAFGGYRVISRRLASREANGSADNIVRIRPFAIKVADGAAPPEEWPERPAPVIAPVNQVMGRIVVMDEAAIREGDLTKIEEYAIGTAPLTLGRGEDCDIHLPGEPSIAMEEARLWLQKGRLVYHKLTTLSAMATEGITSGWLLLANGEEMHLGKYRLLFQAEVFTTVEEPEAAEELELEPNKHFRGWSS